MIEIKVDGYTLFEMTTTKDVGYLRQQIADQEKAIEALTAERDRLREELKKQ